MATVESLLAAWGIRLADQWGDELDRIAALPHEAVIKTALECGDLRDFRRRLGTE